MSILHFIAAWHCSCFRWGVRSVLQENSRGWAVGCVFAGGNEPCITGVVERKENWLRKVVVYCKSKARPTISSWGMPSQFGFSRPSFLSIQFISIYSIISFLLQINAHWSANEKPEMTPKKLQKVFATVVQPQFRVRWLKWWNSSDLSREALHFLSPGFIDATLESWLPRAKFWAEVTCLQFPPSILATVYFQSIASLSIDSLNGVLIVLQECMTI